MTSAGADRNLLFGILAFQLDFITRDQLIGAIQAWVLDKERLLDDILREKQFLGNEQYQLLSALVAEHLRVHGDDPENSLATLSSLGSVHQELTQINDSELQKLLRLVSSQPTISRSIDAESEAKFTERNRGGPEQRFRILRPHDEGGLGKVWVALDQELNREVALKEIKPKYAADEASRSRFVLEAEITGGLEHPGIVPVYGLGHYADGRPYYAMRFIRGDSLRKAIKDFHETDWSQRDTGEQTLKLRRLLGRFLDVCHAVHYAHRRGVLHRDLKPGNIMLGEYGETLVVDWGLAKATGHRDDKARDSLPAEETLLPRSGSSVVATKQGAVIGSPAYMSPEQACGEHDQLGVATDVYSLGATLYTLLTNAPPVEGETGEEVLAKVRLGTWRRPRELKRDIPRPLEAICLKAMSLAPAERYASARALADDVERYLADEPVSAHCEPWPDRINRLARRYRTLVRAAAAALVLVTLVAVVAAVAINDQRKQAVEARKESDQSTARAERVLDVLVNSLRRLDPSIDGREVTVASVLDQAMNEVDNLADNPRDQAALLDALARTYRGLGLYDKQLATSKKLFNLVEENELNIEETVTSMNHLAVGYLDAGQSQDARPLLEKALELSRAQLGTDHPSTITSMNNLATFYQREGQVDKAIPLLEMALDLGRARLGKDHPDTLTWMNNLAMAYKYTGQTEKAMPLLEDTLRLMNVRLGEDHFDTVKLIGNLASVYQDAGQVDKSLPLFEKTLKHTRARLGAEHSDTLTSMERLAGGYRAVGKFGKAVPLLEQMLELSRAKFGEEHPYTLTSMHNLGTIYREAGQIEKAITLLESLVLIRAKLGAGHPEMLASKNNLAFVYLDIGQTDNALQILEKTRDLFLVKLGQDHPITLISMHNLAMAYRAAGQFDESLTLLETTLALRRAKLGDDHPDTLKTSRDLACALISSGRSDDERLDDNLKRERHRLTDKDPRLANILVDVGNCLLEAKRFEMAESLLREALQVFDAAKVDDWRRAFAQSMLGAALVGQEKCTEAEPLLIQGYEGMKQREQSTPRPLPKHLQSAAQRLVDFYKARDNLNEVAKWHLELERATAEVERLRNLAPSVDANPTATEPNTLDDSSPSRAPPVEDSAVLRSARITCRPRNMTTDSRRQSA